MTDAEQKLWHNIRRRQINNCRFRRQQIIDLYIVDFVCLENRLIIEVDGSQHNEDVDKKRTKYLEGQGFKIVRFWNNDVLQNIESVLQRIYELTLTNPPSNLPPQGGKAIEGDVL
jgi:very-short-patch-repair endonuclease